MVPDVSINPEKQAQQLKLLNEVSALLQSFVTSDHFAQQVVQTVQTRFNYYCLQLWTVSSDGSAQLIAQSGAYTAFLKLGHIMSMKEGGVTQRVIQTRKSYLASDTSKDPHFTNLSLPVLSKSELCIPVIRNGEILATLNVESDHTNAFDEQDVMTLESIASQVAVALTNQKLYAEAKDFNSKLSAAVEEKTQELQKANDRIIQQQKLLEKENRALKSMVRTDSRSMDFIGESRAVHNILQMVDKIAPTSASVLVQGESGTGKELIARRLHQRGDRAGQAYVTVNCGALQEALLESELFGHEKGAFTGALQQKIGLAETADGGTLFLDEIGELSLGIQSKLLRFLQEGEFYRIGGKKPIQVNVRIISATNRDLEQEVKNGRFREDLFYRLNTITLRMPPLRERKEDIPLLVGLFLKESKDAGQSGMVARKIEPRALESLGQYDWPGNVRELQNTIERLKILSDHTEIRLEDIPFEIRMPKARFEGPDLNVALPLEEVERRHILRALGFFQGNKTKSAKSLGITIKTLYNKLHRYGLIGTDEQD